MPAKPAVPHARASEKGAITQSSRFASPGDGFRSGHSEALAFNCVAKRKLRLDRWLSTDCICAALGAPKRGIGIAIFRNKFIDRCLARAHPAFPAVFFVPTVSALMTRHHQNGLFKVEALLCSVGILIFTFIEYAVHRWLFHRKVPASVQGKVQSFLMHGYHHHYPMDPTRLVLPPLVTLPLALAVFSVLVGALGPPGNYIFAGITLGYVCYDSLHYCSHHSRTKRGPLAWLRRYHALHHRSAQPNRFGVSSPLWDRVFGTYGSVRSAELCLSARRATPKRAQVQ